MWNWIKNGLMLLGVGVIVGAFISLNEESAELQRLKEEEKANQTRSRNEK